MKGKMKEAKMKMLAELKKAMSDDMYSPMSDALKDKKMKKVTVMSDSEEGLKKGLSKAEEIMKKKSEMEGMSDEDESMEDEMMEDESEEMEDESEDEMNKEQIMATIEMLQKKLNKMV